MQLPPFFKQCQSAAIHVTSNRTGGNLNRDLLTAVARMKMCRPVVAPMHEHHNSEKA